MLGADRAIVVADRAMRERVPAIGCPATVLPSPERETDKTLVWLDQAASRALEDGVTRRSAVISFGGGVACNMAGMLAGTLFRGIRLIHVPTTLLAMHDTVTSLKQAVNVGGHKNMLGLYHTPHAILCDTEMLRTLPHVHVQAALVEIIKNGLILGEPFAAKAKALCARPDDCVEIIAAGVAAKQSLMVEDPYERGQAVVFEYGHTVAHAIEATGMLSHGHSVYWGMRVAGQVARAMGIMPAKAHREHEAMLDWAGDIAAPAERLRAEALLEAVAFDNKRGHLPAREGHAAMVLLQEIGQPAATGGVPLVHVPESTLLQAIRTLAFVD